MIYLYWKNLIFHEANALQFGIVKGLISPLTLLGFAINIKNQLETQETPIDISAAVIIYECQKMQSRCSYTSYIPGDRHIFKKRIHTAPKQLLDLDIILRIKAIDENRIIETITNEKNSQSLRQIKLAKSFCTSLDKCQPSVFRSNEDLFKNLLERPLNGFLPIDYQARHIQNLSTQHQHYDKLDYVIDLLNDSKEYEAVHGKSCFVPLVMGLRLLEQTKERKYSRNNFLHAYAEPLIGIAQTLYLHQLELEDINRIFWKYKWQNNDYITVSDGHL